jgi:hypothetical protein
MRYNELIENDENDDELFAPTQRVQGNIRRVTFQHNIPQMIRHVQQGLLGVYGGQAAKEIAAEFYREANFMEIEELRPLARELFTHDAPQHLHQAFAIVSEDPAIIEDEDRLADTLMTNNIFDNIRNDSELWAYATEMMEEFAEGDGDLEYHLAMEIEGTVGHLIVKMMQDAYHSVNRATELEEAPLADYVPMGNFEKPGPFRGADKKLIPHPTNQLKTAKFFEQTPYDFRLFFSNIPGTGRYSEYGPMRPEVVQEIFGANAQQILAGHEDAITVVFVGNKGDSKVMLTPWMMAHRIGHAVQAGTRRGGGQGAWQQAEDHFFRGINELLKEFYKRSAPNDYSSQVNWKLNKEYTALFNAIGTQRSSRTGQIARPYEFLYELFAQYLGTGQITLNPLPKSKEYGRKVFGRSTQSLRMTPGAEEDSQYTTEVLARDMEIMFSDVLSELVGKVLVM